MTDPDKPTREYVLRKQIQEAHNAHIHDTMFPATFVLLVVVGNLRAGDAQYPGIGNGHTIGIAGNILEDEIDTFGRRARVNDPVFGKALLADLLINDETFLLEPSGKQRHESPSEFGTHGYHRKKEVVVFTALEMMPRAMLVYPATRNNAVNMRMVVQIRAPRMEYGSHTSKQSLTSGKCADGSPCRLEHTVVEDALVGYSNRMQAIRHSEYDMEVLDRDNLFPAESDPLLTLLVPSPMLSTSWSLPSDTWDNAYPCSCYS